MEGLGLRLNHEGSWASFLDSTLDRSLNHADAHTGSFALRCTESIYQLLLNGNYAGAIHRFGEIQRMRKRTSLAGTNDRAAP
jgi:hypothetical protein